MDLNVRFWLNVVNCGRAFYYAAIHTVNYFERKTALNDGAVLVFLIVPFSGMALSRRFASLRKHGEDGNAAMDPSFLHEKIHVMSQVAPRHSWGGTASTQTKIDVQDEDLKSIKGNLAYRFKAAKSIYARHEDLTVEPLGRDER